jgi:hypothetical protein
MADNLIAVGVADAVSILVGLTLVGCMTPENRWRNIILVAAGVWVTDVLPAAIGTMSLSFSGWMGSIVWYAILAALSGVISLLIIRRPSIGVGRGRVGINPIGEN